MDEKSGEREYQKLSNVIIFFMTINNSLVLVAFTLQTAPVRLSKTVKGWIYCPVFEVPLKGNADRSKAIFAPPHGRFVFCPTPLYQTDLVSHFGLVKSQTNSTYLPISFR